MFWGDRRYLYPGDRIAELAVESVLVTRLNGTQAPHFQGGFDF
jgi:hypothetical protein